MGHRPVAEHGFADAEADGAGKEEQAEVMQQPGRIKRRERRSSKCQRKAGENGDAGRT